MRLSHFFTNNFERFFANILWQFYYSKLDRKRIHGTCSVQLFRSSRSAQFNLVAMARRPHPIPSRTRKLSALASMVLQGRLCGRVERCRVILQKALFIIAMFRAFFVCPAWRANPACGTQASPRPGGRQSELQGRCWQRQGLKEAI